jgi:uncharacterized protein (TIGR02466 family)|tara:strand:- start:283 stop:903 length:621 start_codon:yes stop_codon:yes gene_type:complete
MTDTYFYFASPVYASEQPEFLDVVSEVSKDMLAKLTHDPHEIYPMFNTDDFATDPRMNEFCAFVAQTGWNVLKEQGYAMENFSMSVDSAWSQKHFKHSLMEQHVHGGSQLVGFYFLETPENCSRPLFHDPRPGKLQGFLPESDINQATLASNTINFEPKPGMLILSNAWLPHSFGRHGSDEPLEFVHFNLNAVYTPQCNAPPAEVV